MRLITTRRRQPLASRPTLIAVLAVLVAASLGLSACGGSSSTTTTQTSANAAATTTAGTPAGGATTGTSASGTSSTGASTTGTSTTGTSTTGTTTHSPANTSRLASIRSCLAKKGITAPAGSPLGEAKLPKGMSRTQFYEELRTCAGGLLPGRGHFNRTGNAKGLHNPFGNPRFRAVLVRFATCLRQNGVNVGEPNTSGKGPVFDTKGVNTGSPQFKSAATKCRSTLLSGLRSGKPSPGASKAP